MSLSGLVICGMNDVRHYNRFCFINRICFLFLGNDCQCSFAVCCFMTVVLLLILFCAISSDAVLFYSYRTMSISILYNVDVEINSLV